MKCNQPPLGPATRRLRFTAFSVLVPFCLLLPGSSAAPAEPENKSLQEIYAEAERLAETPGDREEAVAKYRAVVEIHRANEERYRSALRRLARCYAEAERLEEGMRFFLELARQSQADRGQDALREIVGQYRLKNPELFEKVVADMGLSSGPRPRVAETMPAEEIAKAILQRDDQELRDKSLQKLRQMLAAESTVAEKRTALATLHSSLAARFDRAPLHALVLPLLASDDAPIRASALRCLPGLEATEGDLDSIAHLAGDESPPVRRNVGFALVQIGKGEEQEIVIPALMKLLEDQEAAVVEQTLRSMWGQYSSPEFDALLIKLSREPRYHHNVIYFGLSTMRPKSVPVCRRLVEDLADPDWNNSGRAAWGLTYGAVAEAKPLVEEGLLKALPEETNAYTRGQEFRALRNVATERSRAYLTKVAESETETEEFRGLAREILAELDNTQITRP